jgi:predicted metalloprotease with PDZ domain
MVNFDMVGRLRNDHLIVYGVATATELKPLVDSLNKTAAFRLDAVGDGYGPSDQSSFYGKDIPVLHFFTDLHEDYHRTTDDADKINAAGEAKVVDYAEAVIRSIADRPARLTFVRLAAPSMAASSREGSNVYLGTIPNMGSSDTTGMEITGVRAGSPADLAGMKAGDVIIEFNGKAVKDLYSYSDALFACKAGDTVKIVVRRNGTRLILTATLATRGG